MNVELVWITPNPEAIIAEIARVSNPENQKNPEYAKLVKYLIEHKHWSPFEMSSFCVKIVTSRAITTQILRHRSLNFQEYSQRYSEVTDFEPIELRKQALKNRQSSEEVFNPIIRHKDEINIISANELVEDVIEYAEWAYHALIDAGISKESARFILPLTSQTTLYVAGNCRSWLTYLNLRLETHTQKEHREIAQKIAAIMTEQYPIVSEAVNHFNNYQDGFI